MTDKLTSASEYWNLKWENGHDQQDWSQVQDEVLSLQPLLKERGVKRVLDLGAGIGRHALFFAQCRYETWAADSSSAGLRIIEEEAAKQQIEVNTEQVDILALPFADSSFDYVLSWNVLYHGDFKDLQRAILEVQRVVLPGGIFQGTFISKNNFYFGQGKQLDSNTYVCDDKSDKAHPHCYVDQDEVVQLLSHFDIRELTESDHGNYKGAFHYHVVAIRQ